MKTIESYIEYPYWLLQKRKAEAEEALEAAEALWRQTAGKIHEAIESRKSLEDINLALEKNLAVQAQLYSEIDLINKAIEAKEEK